MLKKIFIAFVFLGLAACAGVMLPPLTPTQTSWAIHQWPGSTAEEVAGLRELYVSKCGGCHNVVLPETRSMEEWRVMVDKMEVRSKITPSQKENILRYLATAKSAP